MKNIVMLLIVLFSAGCSYHRIMLIDVKGDNIRTPYGRGNGMFYYNSVISIGANATK